MRDSGSPDWENLTTEQYFDIATGHDIAAWHTQQEAFAELRDLCEEVAAECRAEVDRLRETGAGSAVRALEASFQRMLSALEALRDSAASNSDGMREMTAAMRELEREARMLRTEDQEWQRNPDGDDRDTVRQLRDSLRGELRDKVIESDEQFQRLAASYLLPPPETPPAVDVPAAPKSDGDVRASESTPRASEPKASDNASSTPKPAPQAIEDTLDTQESQDTRADGPPRLQTAPPPQQAPASADAATPMMPMGGETAAGGGTGAGGGSGRSGGPAFEETKQQPRSRMRSSASRQELRNQSQYGQYHRPDSQRQRRVAGAQEDSPFASDAQVVPPVVSGSAPPVGPHDSGPVVTGTVYRYFPGYGAQPEPRPFEETFDDGARAQVHVPKKNKHDDAGSQAEQDTTATSQPPSPRPEAIPQQSRSTSTVTDHSGGADARRGRQDSAEPAETPAPETDAGAQPATSSGESLADQRQRRREARQQRRLATHDGQDE